MSRYWMTLRSPFTSVDPGGIRTLISWVQTRGPSDWTTDPFLSALREGFEPSSSTFGGLRSDPIELPQQTFSRRVHAAFVQWFRQDSNLQHPVSETGDLLPLGY